MKKVWATGAGCQRDGGLSSDYSTVNVTREKPYVGQARRLDDHTVELCHLCGQLLQCRDQITPHRATDAPVHHFEDLLLGLELRVLGKQLVINANLFAFVLRVDLFDSTFVIAEKSENIPA